jgi:hypothetical protein
MYSVHNTGDAPVTFKRWLPTFLAFPVGGYLAIETIGSRVDPLSAAAGGLVVGALIGAGQWLALRPGRIGRRWAAYTAVAAAGGTALAAAVAGTGTGLGDLALNGLITGAAVGAAQSALLGRAALARVAWTAVTAASWALGWLVTGNVIVDAERGHHAFGSSGAIVATVVTGLALRRILGTRAGAGHSVRPTAAPSA